MITARRCFAAAVVLVVFAALPVCADSAEEAARRFLRLAYEGSFDALPKAPNAQTEQFERKVRNMLRVRCARVAGIVMHSRAESAGQATFALEVLLLKTDRETPSLAIPPEFASLRLKLVRNAEEWQVSAVEFPDAEFAEQLVSAGKEERDRLLRDHPDRVSSGVARALNERCMALMNRGNFNACAEIAPLAKEIAAASGDRGGEALILGALSYASDKRTALDLTAEALAIAETLNDPDVLARAWYNRGRSLSAQYWEARRSGSVDAARMEAYRKAVPYAERAEDPITLIRLYYSMANLAAYAQGDNVTARRYVDHVLPLARETGDVTGEATLESVLATIYEIQADSARTIYHLDRAIVLAERHGLWAYPTLLLRSACLRVAEKRWDEARALFDKVLKRDERGRITAPLVPKNHIGSALLCLSGFETAQGRLDDAECLIREAAAVQGAEPNVFLFHMTPHYLERRDYAAALRTSLASLTESGLRGEERMDALANASRAYRGLGQYDRAFATLLEAIEIREEINARTAGDEQQRARTSDRTIPYYDRAAELVIDRGGRPEEAVVFLERGRATVLTGILENGRPGAMAQADAAREEERVRREREMNRISVELDAARAAGNSAAAADLAERLRNARAVHATLLDGIRTRSERRLSVRRTVSARSVAGAIARLPRTMAAIEYALTENALHLFVVRSGEPVVHRSVAVTRDALEQRAARFVDALSQRSLDVHDAARDLYDLLIAPVERDLHGAEALLLIPDEMLWRVPFAALLDGRRRFLTERWATVYAPSLTAYALIAGSKPPAAPRPPALFAVGNPRLLASARSAVTSFYRDTALDPLPDAEREVDGLRPLYGRHSVVLKGGEATETRAKSAIGKATVVHLATHALFDDSNPMYSRLALAYEESAPDDGWLESWEIAQLDLQADVVVLSACETARGRISGEGVVGMAWSFFLAGARATVATQWKVASRSTADFMTTFHRALRSDGGDPALAKAQALRRAQLHLLRQPSSRHPFYWAPFVLFGG